MRNTKIDKAYVAKKANKKWRHELERKKKRKMKRYQKKLENLEKIRRGRIPRKKFEAPSMFSFIENTDELTKYFDRYIKYVKNNDSIEFDLKNIDILTFDSISILLANIKDKKFSKCSISGNAPHKEELRSLFVKSDFYSFVDSQIRPPRDFIQGKAINHVSNKKVSPEIAGEINAEFAKMNPAERRKLYNILIECMQNTMEHAGEGFNWWIFYYDNKEKGTKEVCFLDLGTGILGSLNTKFEDFRDYIADYNKDKLKQLFAGEWKKNASVTKERKRGNGLKDIYHFSKIPAIKKFIVITNQVKADLKNDTYTKLRYNFGGTFYYWEI